MNNSGVEPDNIKRIRELVKHRELRMPRVTMYKETYVLSEPKNLEVIDTNYCYAYG